MRGSKNDKELREDVLKELHGLDHGALAKMVNILSKMRQVQIDTGICRCDGITCPICHPEEYDKPDPWREKWKELRALVLAGISSYHGMPEGYVSEWDRGQGNQAEWILSQMKEMEK